MSIADNYNEYDYNQVLGEKHIGQRQYTIRDLSMKFGLEVWIKSEIQHQEVDVER